MSSHVISWSQIVVGELSEGFLDILEKYPERYESEIAEKGMPLFGLFTSFIEKFSRWLSQSHEGFKVELACRIPEEGGFTPSSRWSSQAEFVLSREVESSSTGLVIPRLHCVFHTDEAGRQVLWKFVDNRENKSEEVSEQQEIFSRRVLNVLEHNAGANQVRWTKVRDEDQPASLLELSLTLPAEGEAQRGVLSMMWKDVKDLVEVWSEYEADIKQERGKHWTSSDPAMIGRGRFYDMIAHQFRSEFSRLKCTNRILFGPPGTGKTYHSARHAVSLCEGDEAWLSPGKRSDDEVRQKYQQLRAAGRIEMVTFHQSYGYEEFVEGIRPALAEAQYIQPQDEDVQRGEVQYILGHGAFKRIALLAASAGLRLSAEDAEFERRWEALWQLVQASDSYEVKGKRDSTIYILTTRPGNEFQLERKGSGIGNRGSYKIVPTTAQRHWDALQAAKNDKEKQEALLEEMGTAYFPILRTLIKLKEEEIKAIELRQSMSGLDPESRIRYAVEALQSGDIGAFSTFEEDEQYVLIIDEINRGNISKILGELMTLLEPTKRLAHKEETLLRLPYSQQLFGVPPNLHIIGTMNTADRSIALMDVALRRRFQFEEMLPDGEVIRTVLANKLDDRRESRAYVDLEPHEEQHIELVVAIFEAINERLVYLYDEDHQIGHSYYLDAVGPTELRDALVHEVIPLLQEYFYNQWDQICMVLGCPYTSGGRSARENADNAWKAIIKKEQQKPNELFMLKNSSEYEVRTRFFIDGAFKTAKTPERLMPYLRSLISPERFDAIFEEQGNSEEPEARGDSGE